MKIVVNTRLLISKQLSGIGWFTYNTLKRIVKKHPEHQFIFLFDRKFEEQYIFSSNVSPEIVFPPTRHPLLWYLWFEYAIVNKIKKHKPDLFFSPEGYLSTRIKEIPSIPVIHDINFHHNPNSVPYWDGKFWRHYFPVYAQMAKRIITVSEFSKNDISLYYNIPLSKIDVAYNGINELYAPVPENIKQNIKEKYADGQDYFIYVGVLVPRKNITRMLKAFEKFKKTSGSKIKLIIVGDSLYFTPEMKKEHQRSAVKNDIVFTGRLSDSELQKVMGAALSLILVSVFEGFGIPIIEAMRSEIPVITSDTSSMPEIAGDAALITNPYSVDSISNAMLSMANDKKLRDELIRKGRKQCEKFNWDTTSGIVWNTIEKVVKQ